MQMSLFGLVFSFLNIPLALFALSLFAIGFVPPDKTVNLFLADETQAMALRNLSINWQDENVRSEVTVLSTTSTIIGGLYAVISIVVIAGSCHLDRLHGFLVFYVIGVGLLLVAFVALTFFLGAGQQWVFTVLRSTVRSGYEKNNANNATVHDATTMFWNTVQVTLQCCGYAGGLDYSNKITATLPGSYISPNRTMIMVIPPSCCTVPALTAPATVYSENTAYHPIVQCVYYASSHYSNFHTGCIDKLWPFAMTLFGITMASCWYLLFLLAMATHSLTNRIYVIPSRSSADSSRSRRRTTVDARSSSEERQRLEDENAC